MIFLFLNFVLYFKVNRNKKGKSKANTKKLFSASSFKFKDFIESEEKQNDNKQAKNSIKKEIHFSSDLLTIHGTIDEKSGDLLKENISSSISIFCKHNKSAILNSGKKIVKQLEASNQVNKSMGENFTYLTFQKSIFFF